MTKQIEGILSVIAIDYENGSSATEYILEDKNDKTKKYKLQFVDKKPHVYHGSIVKAKNIKTESLKTTNTLPNIELSYSDLEILYSPSLNNYGEQKTIVIFCNFSDKNILCSYSDIDNLFFTGTNSINTFYYETSFNKMWISGIVAGLYNLNYTESPCSTFPWSADLESQAQNSGINLSEYNRRFYVFPDSPSCGVAGTGTIGGNPSMSWIFRCSMSDVYAHELGHNLGMDHAATPASQIGDISDIMGYSGVGLRYINAPHQEQMGWLDTLKFQTITHNGTYNISPLELDTSKAQYPQILKFPKPDTSDTYYLSYRQPIGFDTTLSSTYTKGVNIHHYISDSATRTYFLSSLGDGEIYSDSVNGIIVTQLTHNSDYVTVDIKLISTCPQINATLEII